jgi:hypothetical protein
MNAMLKDSLLLCLELTPFWVLHVAYWCRKRSRVARGVLTFWKLLYGKPEQPDQLVRDWIILIWPIILFLAVIFVLSSGLE